MLSDAISASSLALYSIAAINSSRLDDEPILVVSRVLPKFWLSYKHETDFLSGSKLIV